MAFVAGLSFFPGNVVEGATSGRITTRHLLFRATPECHSGPISARKIREHRERERSRRQRETSRAGAVPARRVHGRPTVKGVPVA